MTEDHESFGLISGMYAQPMGLGLQGWVLMDSFQSAVGGGAECMAWRSHMALEDLRRVKMKAIIILLSLYRTRVQNKIDSDFLMSPKRLNTWRLLRGE